MMKVNNLVLLATVLFSAMPLVSLAEYKTPKLAVTDQFNLDSKSTNSYMDHRGFMVLEASSYYQAVSPSELLQPKFDKTKLITKTMKLRDKVKKNLSDINIKDAKSTLALKKWNDFEPKIKRIIKKEKELDELLDYISRLKKVSTKRKDSPNTIRRAANGKSTQTSEISCSKKTVAYRWPRNCS
ncbi:MAG: hypothetical protein ISEC1_P1360 [Thiomicrorhabdus sp.]|nr:MAG: hypothetical protein ISEC1_P1360 [Thiomicrorhabdus sp.]